MLVSEWGNGLRAADGWQEGAARVSRIRHIRWIALLVGSGILAIAVITRNGISLRRVTPANVGPRMINPTPAAVVKSTTANRPALWVLAIGVSGYSDPSLRLRFAAADARTVADALARQGEGPLYSAVNSMVLIDAQVTRSSILRATDDFLGQASPIDVGVIYMAGHGVRDEALDRYYFLPANAAAEKPRIEGLDMDDFNRQLRMLHRNLRRLVVILDTCHAGALASGQQAARLGEDLATRLSPAEGLYILAAARSGEQSREIATLGHGVFTQALLDGLQGAAADTDGLVRILGLASYTARVVPQLTDKKQTPYLSIVGEDLPLGVHPERFADVAVASLPTPAALTALAPPRERIAVMQFENLRPDPKHDWMQQALGEQFATTLHQLPRFDVYDERMVRFLARGAADPIEASRRADMGKLVSGAYWVHNDSISITAHVKNTDPLSSIASAQIDGPLDRFSELTGEVVVRLLQKMHVELSSGEIDQILQRNTTDLAARKLLFDAERAGRGGVGSQPAPALGDGPEASLPRWLFGHLHLVAISHAADGAPVEIDLRTTLEGYRQAFERRNLDDLGRYYADFAPQQRAALQRYFENADQLQVTFSDIQIAIIGEQAAVSLSRRDQFIDHKSGERQQVVVRVTKLFLKGTAGWQMVPEQ